MHSSNEAVKTRRSRNGRADGFVVVYMATVLVGLLLVSALAVDTGQAYMVKAQLSKAVDGAALGAARNLNSGNPQAVAQRIFTANFPAGYMGTTAVTGPTFALTTDAATGRNIVTVGASATMPTAFMRLADVRQITVASSAEATRRMVDLSLVVDVSSSIGSKWTAVRDAIRTFVDSFDQSHDRMALITFGNGAKVLDSMPSGRGFNKSGLESDVPNSLPGGSTLMVEGLYRGWDELRTVPAGTQSSLRVIVLFTDGASNGVPGMYDTTGVAKSLRTYDFPKNANDPDSQTWNQPHIDGLYDSQSGTQQPSYSLTVSTWNSTQTLSQVPLLPLTTSHSHARSSGIPTSFPLQTSSLTVNGSAQSSRRGLRNKDTATNRYPADVWNINNAARNVLEMIANGARSDTGDYPIRIYTIGMGYLVRDDLGTIPEKPEDILKRVANDRTSADFNSKQLEGKYFYAETEDDVAPAFDKIQNEIVRLSK